VAVPEVMELLNKPSENVVIVMYVPGGMAAPLHRDIEAAVMAARAKS